MRLKRLRKRGIVFNVLGDLVELCVGRLDTICSWAKGLHVAEILLPPATVIEYETEECGSRN